MAQELIPDVVVMDINMRGMNGIEATRAIRSMLPDLQVVALSMFEEAQHGRTMRAAGALAYLSKTEPPPILIDTIHSCRS
jgi:DNA-binding NarL/FixJ family response regulator